MSQGADDRPDPPPPPRREVVIPERLDEPGGPAGPTGPVFGAPPGPQAVTPEQMAALREEAEFQELLSRTSPHARVTQGLVIANVLVFLRLTLAGVPLLAPTAVDMLPWGANFAPRTTAGEWWRLGSCMFLHYGLIHIGFNMWILRAVGPLLERLIGSAGFLMLYLFSGLLGSLASIAWNPLAVSAGASGAIFGVIGGLLALVAGSGPSVLPPARRAHLRRAVGTFVLYNLAFGLVMPSVDMAGHLGGLVGGLLCGLALRHPDMLRHLELRQRLNLRLFGAGVVLLPALAFAVPRDTAEAHAALDGLVALERGPVAELDRVIITDDDGELQTDEALRLLDSLLPEWRAAEERLGAVSGNLPELLAEDVDRLHRYATARRLAWEALTRALRADDDALAQRELETFSRYSREAEGLARPPEDAAGGSGGGAAADAPDDGPGGATGDAPPGGRP